MTTKAKLLEELNRVTKSLEMTKTVKDQYKQALTESQQECEDKNREIVELNSRLLKYMEYIKDDTRCLNLKNGFKFIKLIEIDDEMGGFIVTIEKNKELHKGYGRTLQNAYDMACLRKYNLIPEIIAEVTR